MDAARIAELLHPFVGRAGEQPLTPHDLEHISMYIDILVRWNSRINLTAIRDPEDIVTRHFGESLFAASNLFPRGVGTAAGCSQPPPTSSDDLGSNGRTAARQRETGRTEPRGSAPRACDQRPTTAHRISVADVGSGAGFPGVPLKLWAPSIQLTLIEANQKKSIFLREIVRSLTLRDVDIKAARAETLPPASFDVVTLRAAERFATVLPIAAALLKPHGRLALLIGSAQVDRAQSLLPDRGWVPPLPIPRSHSRVLLSTGL
jgi:16S rRNA (guanine527-N7)-methyltransferase